MISQVREETLELPEGVVLRLEANQMIRVEAHFLNYFPEDITARGDVEFITQSDGTYDHLADFLFYGSSAISVPPGESSSSWFHLDAPNGAKIFALTGHTHQWGTNVEVGISPNQSTAGTSVYPGDTPFQWDEAPIVQFSPPVEIAPGDGFRFRCSWNNTSGQFVSFGESAEQEMCFFWAYYYPSQGYRVCAPPIFGCATDG